MTETITQKIKTAAAGTKETAVEVFKLGMMGLITIWAMAIVAFIAWHVFNQSEIDKNTAWFWSFITTVISSLFLSINYLFKRNQK